MQLKVVPSEWLIKKTDSLLVTESDTTRHSQTLKLSWIKNTLVQSAIRHFITMKSGIQYTLSLSEKKIDGLTDLHFIVESFQRKKKIKTI